MKKIIILYFPVLHEGYKRFLDGYKDIDTIYIFGDEIISMFDYLEKEIRALKPKYIKKALESWGYKNIKILDLKSLEKLNKQKYSVITSDEDVCRDLVTKYLSQTEVTYNSVFLRWDKHNAALNKSVNINQKISKDEFDKTIINLATKESKKSSDWWRQVGAVVIKNKKVLLLGHNHHVPSPHTPYIDGDPRNAFHKGKHIDLSTAIHAEASLIAEAARKGLLLEGSSMYVSTFPCPACAKLIAFSGVKKLYYSGGYGVLDGDTILKSQQVEIIYVDLD